MYSIRRALLTTQKDFVDAELLRSEVIDSQWTPNRLPMDPALASCRRVVDWNWMVMGGGIHESTASGDDDRTVL